MSKNFNEEIITELMEIKGEVRGAVFQTDGKYVLEKEGEEGLKKLEKRVKDLGLEIDYRSPEVMAWRPFGSRIVSLLLIKDTFSWSDEEIRKMGKMAPKFSFIVKFIFKIFSPLKKLIKEIPGFWEKHYSVGEIEVTKFDEEKKEFTIHLKGVKGHPLFCFYLEGYFERVIMFVEKNVVSKEIKCIHKDSPQHEYLFKW